MNRSNDQQQTRRDWLQAGLRWVALGGITGLSAVVINRQRDNGPCRREAACCQACPVLAECRLPQAAAAKHRDPV